MKFILEINIDGFAPGSGLPSTRVADLLKQVSADVVRHKVGDLNDFGLTGLILRGTKGEMVGSWRLEEAVTTSGGYGPVGGDKPNWYDDKGK